MIEINKIDLSKLNVIGNVQRSKTKKLKDEIKSLKEEIKRLKDEKEVAEGNYFYIKGILDKLKEKVEKENYIGYSSGNYNEFVNHYDIYLTELIQKLEKSNNKYKWANRRLVTENEALREQVRMLSNQENYKSYEVSGTIEGNGKISDMLEEKYKGNDDRTIAEKFLDGWIDLEGD